MAGSADYLTLRNFCNHFFSTFVSYKLRDIEALFGPRKMVPIERLWGEHAPAIVTPPLRLEQVKKVTGFMYSCPVFF